MNTLRAILMETKVIEDTSPIHQMLRPKELSNTEKNAIKQYTSSSYYTTNQGLRANPPFHSPHSKILSAAISRHLSPKKTVLYTGVHANPSFHDEDRIKPRENFGGHFKIHNPAYTSATTRQSIAEQHMKPVLDSGNHMMKLHIPKHAAMISVMDHSYFPEEEEVILHHGAKFHVKDNPIKHKLPGGEHFHMWNAHMVHDGIKPVGDKS